MNVFKFKLEGFNMKYKLQVFLVITKISDF